jgi:hypothetical protein
MLELNSPPITLNKVGAAYVASTLPIAILKNMIDQWNIKKIYLCNSRLIDSYKFIQLNHPEVQLRVLENGYLGAMQILYLQLRTIFFRENIFFFHECCCTVFDILAIFLRPIGYYYPQVSMSGFEEITASEWEQNISKTKTLGKLLPIILILLGLKDKFTFYRGFGDGNTIFYVCSLKKYHPNIEMKSLNESRQLAVASNSKFVKNSKILFLAGRDSIDDRILYEKYQCLISMSQIKGYCCYVKDHPNESGRLNFYSEGVEIIDPSIPVELLDNDYSLVVGVASTGLVPFRERAVSIIDWIGMTPKAHKFRKAHLLEIPGGEDIKFIKSLDEFASILDGMSTTG